MIVYFFTSFLGVNYSINYVQVIYRDGPRKCEDINSEGMMEMNISSEHFFKLNNFPRTNSQLRYRPLIGFTV